MRRWGVDLEERHNELLKRTKTVGFRLFLANFSQLFLRRLATPPVTVVCRQLPLKNLAKPMSLRAPLTAYMAISGEGKFAVQPDRLLRLTERLSIALACKSVA